MRKTALSVWLAGRSIEQVYLFSNNLLGLGGLFLQNKNLHTHTHTRADTHALGQN